MLYSVRMRSAEGGAHEMGGRHISGAERLVAPADLAEITQQMIARALSHSRGTADFINIKVEAVPPERIHTVPLLPVRTQASADVQAGRLAARAELLKAGVNAAAVDAGFNQLLSLSDSMRGAMLLCARSGRRLDSEGMRGIRVSRMDIADEAAFTGWLAANGLKGMHVREALVLASKVVWAPGMIAELCWSDDPEYTAGYVAARSIGYVRFPQLKPLGSPVGGRIFFVDCMAELDRLADYLRSQPVLVTAAGEGGER